MNELGIAVRTGVPVQTGVLAGLDPEEIADPTALADMIRAGIAEAGLEGRLGPKVSVVVDGGGRTALDEVAADVRLTAVEISALGCVAGRDRRRCENGKDAGRRAWRSRQPAKRRWRCCPAIADMGREARAGIWMLKACLLRRHPRACPEDLPPSTVWVASTLPLRYRCHP